MSVKLRLRRLGRKKIPIYSIVATDQRNPRDGRYIEDLGRYYPLREPAEVRLDEERALYWLENGAQPSNTVRSVLHRRGLLLHLHLKKKGTPPDEIEEAVAEFRERMVEEGDELKMSISSRGEDPLERERRRAEEIDEEARLRAQATPLSEVEDEPESETEDDEEESEDEEEESEDEPQADEAEESEDKADGENDPSASDEEAWDSDEDKE